VGGRGTSGTPFKTIECYDARQDRWVQVVEMSTRRRHVGVVAVAGLSLAFFYHQHIASLHYSIALCPASVLDGLVPKISWSSTGVPIDLLQLVDAWMAWSMFP